MRNSPYAFLTSKERDNESSLDFFGARYFSGSQGRFTSPDPVTVTPVRMLDPQMFNLYCYTRNNPLKYIDPDGRDLFLVNKDEEGRRRALLSITPNLTTTEQKNIGYRKNASDEYEVYVKDAKAIDPEKSSPAYRYLSGLINDHSISINYGFLSPGHPATDFNGREASVESMRLDDYFGGGVTASKGNGIVDVFVQKHSSPLSVKGLTRSGRDIAIMQTDNIIVAHELFGETFQYRSGNQYLLTNETMRNQTIIKIENEIRQFLGLPLRSGKDHGLGPATTVNVK